jgi:hypothetical protein
MRAKDRARQDRTSQERRCGESVTLFALVVCDALTTMWGKRRRRCLWLSPQRNGAAAAAVNYILFNTSSELGQKNRRLLPRSHGKTKETFEIVSTDLLIWGD